jgi:hypothetical protein
MPCFCASCAGVSALLLLRMVCAALASLAHRVFFRDFMLLSLMLDNEFRWVRDTVAG